MSKTSAHSRPRRPRQRQPQAEPRRTHASSDQARSRILRVAETLFAADGFTGTSTRAIAQAAGVALSRLHYYFGSKRELFETIYAGHGTRITTERRNLLEAALAAAGCKPPKLEALLRAFIEPFMRAAMRPEASAFIRMHARLNAEPKEIANAIRAKVYDETTQQFVAAFRQALPALPAETLYWRLTFVLGAYLYPLLDTGRIEAISKGACRASDIARAIDELMPFLEAGLLAPPPK